VGFHSKVWRETRTPGKTVWGVCPLCGCFLPCFFPFLFTSTVSLFFVTPLITLQGTLSWHFLAGCGYRTIGKELDVHPTTVASLPNLRRVVAQNGMISIIKKEQRRQRAAQKKAEKDQYDEWIRQIEDDRRRAESMLRETVGKAEMKQTQQTNNIVKIKKHSLNGPGGKPRVEVEVPGAEPVWMNVADFWKPENISLFLPPWKAYCKWKVLPLEWRGAISRKSKE
jgi:hypothetical protein